MSVIVAEMNSEGFWRVLCPREEKKIPIYQCAGSFVKGRWMCDYLGYLGSSIGKKEAKVECLWPEKRREA